MAEEQLVKDLEKALLERAEKLAQEYRDRAQRARQHILEDAHERLRIREQNEVLAAQAEAERLFRRQIQANELKLKSKLDKLRWRLVQSILQDLPARLLQTREDQDAYLQLLRRFLTQAATNIESDELVAEVNADDIEYLKKHWDSFTADIAPDKRITLATTPIHCSGGILLRSQDNRIRIDNSFEGRIERFQNVLLRVITERLFAGEISQGGLVDDR
ncbi:V-type ATP synthase subunit E [Thiolapillus sp.]